MTCLVEVFVSIGSNIEPSLHVPQSIKLLEAHFGELQQSNCYESKAVGFDGDNFVNLVVKFKTDKSVADVNKVLHQIEDQEGRIRNNGKAWDSRTMDLDILLYGDECGFVDSTELPRPEVLDQAHVLMPLVELAPNKVHPQAQLTYAELLLNKQFSSEDIWKINF